MLAADSKFTSADKELVLHVFNSERDAVLYLPIQLIKISFTFPTLSSFLSRKLFYSKHKLS